MEERTKSTTGKRRPKRKGFAEYSRSVFVILLILYAVLKAAWIIAERNAVLFDVLPETVRDLLVLSTIITFCLLIASGLVVLLQFLSRRWRLSLLILAILALALSVAAIIAENKARNFMDRWSEAAELLAVGARACLFLLIMLGIVVVFQGKCFPTLRGKDNGQGDEESDDPGPSQGQSST